MTTRLLCSGALWLSPLASIAVYPVYHQVHVRFRLLCPVHDVHQSPWQPFPQLLPHGSDGTTARSYHVHSGGQVSKLWSCLQKTRRKKLWEQLQKTQVDKL